MIGETILHYKIMEKIGEGGMGIVYLAEDTKLERKVALKFLPHHIASNSEEKERFKIEAKAAAALNHPNITTIYAIEENGDDIFIVMEYIDGKELKNIIETHPLAGRQGSKTSLQVNEIINYAAQIAEGLEAAHKKGIIHRDIKSSNIMITKESKVKVMDFGLAKIKGGIELTKAGITVGTTAYMSPEQLKGSGVDQRTDIWSFGVLFYQMLTNELPYKGEYDQAIMYSILNEEPVSASKLNSEVSAQLDNILEKCLKKESKLRYKNFNELLLDMKKTVDEKSTEEDRTQLRRIAILPFVNVSGSQQSDYLGFALADQVIGAITYLKNILVRPSASIRKYMNTFVNPKDAGSELNVDYLLTGNFLKVDEKIRLNIELVEVKTENMVWRTPIEVDFHNAFELQDIVAQRVVHGLNVQFSQKEINRIRKDIPDNPLAYEYYLRSLSYPSTNEGDILANEMLNRSIQVESNYAPAFSELGFRLHRIGIYGLGGPSILSKAEQAFEHALSLNDELLGALFQLSTLFVETARIEKAVELVRKMLAINPNNASAHFSLGYLFRYGGMLEESEKEYDQALSLDPGNPRFRSAGVTYHHLGKYQKAIEALNLDKGSSYALIEIGIIQHHKNKEWKVH